MSLSPPYEPVTDRRGHGTTGPARDTGRLIFVDSTGRRRVLLRRAGTVVGAAFLVYAVLLGVSFMGGTSLAPSNPSPGNGGAATQRPAGDNARPGGEPATAWRAMRLCRKQCRNCGQQPRKQCRRRLFRKEVDRTDGTVPTRSAPASGEGARNR